MLLRPAARLMPRRSRGCRGGQAFVKFVLAFYLAPTTPQHAARDSAAYSHFIIAAARMSRRSEDGSRARKCSEGPDYLQREEVKCAQKFRKTASEEKCESIQQSTVGAACKNCGEAAQRESPLLPTLQLPDMHPEAQVAHAFTRLQPRIQRLPCRRRLQHYK